MTIVDLAREELRGLEPYEAAAQVDGAIRLNANEAHWNTSNGFRRPLNRYPEVRPERLRDRLAEHYGCGAQELLVTRGSSEAIDLLLRTFVRPGTDNVVTPAPTFSMYRHYARVQGAEFREVPTERERDFAVDADDILAACDDDTKLVFLCSPNNPTGTSLGAAKIRQVLQGRTGKSIVVVDEAYVEFSRHASAVSLTGEFENLVVLRTLSKALAFAGARCGSVIGRAPLIALLNAVQAPYALATPVIECIEDVLASERLATAAARIEDTIQAREQLARDLGQFDFVQRLWPSDANFLLLSVSDAERILEAAAEENVLLRHFGGELADCIRVTVGSPEENERLLAAFRRAEDNSSV